MIDSTAFGGDPMATTARRPLHTVDRSERPPAPAPRTISEAASEGHTQRELLVAMRTRIAKSLDDQTTAARDLASLSRRLLEISREIDAIDVADRQEADESGTVTDEAFNASAI